MEGGPDGIAPNTLTPLSSRLNAATMAVSRIRATSAPGTLGAYRFNKRTMTKAPNPIATEYRLARGMDFRRSSTSTK